MTKVTVPIEIDSAEIARYSDQHLALLWHVAQANPAPYGDWRAAELVKDIGSEIIRRWLGKIPAEMYHHQSADHAKAIRMRTATYRPGGADDRDNAFHDGQWTLDPKALDAALAGPPAGTSCPYCAATDNLLRVEHGPGAGQTWICRDSQECTRRLWEAARNNDSLVCARCDRRPGIAAAPAELTQVDGPIELGGPNAQYDPVDLGTVWVCTDRARCDDRIARGARPPSRHDREMAERVAEIGVRNALGQGLGPAECPECGNTVAAELKAPRRVSESDGTSLAGKVIGAWSCRDTNACQARAGDRQADQEAMKGGFSAANLVGVTDQVMVEASRLPLRSDGGKP